MKVNLNSNFNLGKSFSEYAEKKAEACVMKYFDTTTNVSVFASKSANTFKINVVVNDGIKRGVLIKASGESDDIYHAFDLALARTSKQLRKHKSMLQDYRKKIYSLKEQNSDIPYIQVNRTILKENIKNEMEENEEVELNLINEKDTDIEELTPEEAFMKMELINLPAYMFVNKENHQLNVIYRRPDGDFAWLNPKK